MPVIRYTLRSEEGEFSEEDTFPRIPKNSDPFIFIANEIVLPLNANRQKYRQPLLEIADIKIKNPYLHKHEFSLSRKDYFSCKVRYVCAYCEVTAYRTLSLLKGEGTAFFREVEYKADRFAYCQEPLKKMPPAGHLFR